ncbi:hypothetical protein GMOD_00004812 [Pyrenophora seminiperda CCB06]|uniref:Uncharacterized protein n=1 Tax=Pyrenophora seminiperda CCB06 TaxID=1302712 RepID=A0A3M7MI27_9PLEO|nr:hypothetical protein GMOD_00004812 [Pyrenophora seminiperda CCB06]
MTLPRAYNQGLEPALFVYVVVPLRLPRLEDCINSCRFLDFLLLQPSNLSTPAFICFCTSAITTTTIIQLLHTQPYIFTMDFVNKLAGGNSNNSGQSANEQAVNDQKPQQSSGSGGFLGGLGDKLNSAAGGGRESEKNEDYLDKGVDFVQEKFMGAGPQDNESALEQAKDEQISDAIRRQYKSATGSDIPIQDK